MAACHSQARDFGWGCEKLSSIWCSCIILALPHAACCPTCIDHGCTQGAMPVTVGAHHELLRALLTFCVTCFQAQDDCPALQKAPAPAPAAAAGAADAVTAPSQDAPAPELDTPATSAQLSTGRPPSHPSATEHHPRGEFIARLTRFPQTLDGPLPMPSPQVCKPTSCCCTRACPSICQPQYRPQVYR